ncbi:MAG: hypothetical protein DRP79_02550 [Planctomycetota bacterium]|jgi:predicted nucleotidyltransferase|nr:MAG: hypothetical protein DRP79_02550 [Planctomycetota bacterium]
MPRRPKDENIDEFLSRVRRRFGGRLKQAVLFGSRARGDYTEESDYDFILVFDGKIDGIKAAVSDIALDIMIDKGICISTFLYDEDELQESRCEPFLINARREGISL